MDFYTCYNLPPQVVADVSGESLTQSQFADDCDINLLIARLNQGDTSVLRNAGQYFDLASLPADLQSALQSQIDARCVWDANPEIAARFGSVPAFLDFLSNPANRDEAVRLGVIKAVKDALPVKPASDVTPTGVGAEKTTSSSEPVASVNT